jgi:hypothetical protein
MHARYSLGKQIANIMKALLTFFITMVCIGPALSQSVGVGTQTPNASAMLDISSNNKGLLIPRMTENEKAQIANPATGLLVWQTDGTPGFYYNAGTPQGPKWYMLSVADATNWSINGNGNIDPSQNFIGTTNSQPIRFRINNRWAGSIDSAKGTYFGYLAGQNDALGNVAFGDQALSTNENGSGLTAIGRLALEKNRGGSSNTAVGALTMRENTVGNWNTAVGTQSMLNNTTGSENVSIGMLSMYDNKGDKNVAAGVYALAANEGFNNIGLGYYALRFNTSGSWNIGIGSNALRNNISGVSNVGVGISALNANDTGHSNVALGSFALASNKMNYNTAVGARALTNSVSGEENAAMGMDALKNNVIGDGNTAVGFNSQLNSNAHYNTSVGQKSLESNISGIANTAIGRGAMQINTVGLYNSALGANTLDNNTSGDYNTAVGYGAGSGNISGDYNTFLGYNTAVDNSRNNATVIGYRAIGECSNCLILGSINGKNGSIVSTKTGIGTTNPGFLLQVGESGDGTVARANSWTTFSDERYKTQIISIDHALDKLDQIGGYYYQWKDGKDQSRQAGLIAQEVEKVLPEIVQTDEAGYKSVDYGKMNALLIEAVKEQQKLIKQMEQRIANLEKGKK